MAVFLDKVKTAVRHDYHTSNFLGEVPFRDRTWFPQARYLTRVDIDLLPARSMQLDQMKRCDGCGEKQHYWTSILLTMETPADPLYPVGVETDVSSDAL